MAEPLELAGPVGFIGLGIMGSAMSTHLLGAGHRVIGYDVSPAACDAHRARGGTVAGSPAEIAARTSLVVTSLPSAGALTKVLRAPDGLAARAALGLTVIETSTLAPEDKEAERQFLADRQAWLLDCPVSGTGAQARDKDLVAYLSGDEAAKARAWPVLAGMTREIYDAGEFGNGTKLKLVANLLVAVHNVAAAEALVLAERAAWTWPRSSPRSGTGPAPRGCSRSAARPWPPRTTRGRGWRPRCSARTSRSSPGSPASCAAPLRCSAWRPRTTRPRWPRGMARMTRPVCTRCCARWRRCRRPRADQTRPARR